jgi:hypothetical protein
MTEQPAGVLLQLPDDKEQQPCHLDLHIAVSNVQGSTLYCMHEGGLYRFILCCTLLHVSSMALGMAWVASSQAGTSPWGSLSTCIHASSC